MAKTRVYELARDLNLTNQILLSKLDELDISVKSHMSSLDDEAVAKVRTVIYGKKEESIEETRIKPTVIRRRRKIVPVEVVAEPTPDKAEITLPNRRPLKKLSRAKKPLGSKSRPKPLKR